MSLQGIPCDDDNGPPVLVPPSRTWKSTSSSSKVSGSVED
ncbi:AAA domain-containing protein [Psidium guajava]|nr:AAA domain-containing protein [Psidium guajava]